MNAEWRSAVQRLPVSVTRLEASESDAGVLSRVSIQAMLRLSLARASKSGEGLVSLCGVYWEYMPIVDGYTVVIVANDGYLQDNTTDVHNPQEDKNKARGASSLCPYVGVSVSVSVCKCVCT